MEGWMSQYEPSVVSTMSRDVGNLNKSETGSGLTFEQDKS